MKSLVPAIILFRAWKFFILYGFPYLDSGKEQYKLWTSWNGGYSSYCNPNSNAYFLAYLSAPCLQPPLTTMVLSPYFCFNLNTKLTSVKILEDLYERFKLNTVNTKMTLQKLTNHSVDRFLTDEKFREEIETYDNLIVSGSNF